MKVIAMSKELANGLNVKDWSDTEKYECALDTESVAIWDNVAQFQEDLNDGCVNVQYCFIYFLNV